MTPTYLVTFEDGPAAGQSLCLASAPQLLRVTTGPRGVDALDQPEDVARLDETVHAYWMLSHSRLSVTRRTDGGRRKGELWLSAKYIQFPDQIPLEVLRCTQAWQDWLHDNHHRLEGRLHVLRLAKGFHK